MALRVSPHITEEKSTLRVTSHDRRQRDA
jgi:hypothetical protein